MRLRLPDHAEIMRVTTGEFGTPAGNGPNGLFLAQMKSGEIMVMLANSACDESELWEHVSVSFRDRPPTWAEMQSVKELFWDDHEAVIQIHPPKAHYVNFHPHCLHLWRHAVITTPLPPSHLISPLANRKV